MPTSYIRKQASKHGISVKKSEAKWNKAKAIAAKEGKSDNFAYITGIYKSLVGESVSSLGLKQYLSLVEMNDVGEVSYGSPEEEIDYNEDEIDRDEEDDINQEDVKNHKGHQLAGLTDAEGDEDFDTEDDMDHDEDFDTEDDMDHDEDFDTEDDMDHDEMDDQSQGQGEFRSSKRRKSRPTDGYNGMGESTSCDFIRDLMLITEKKKPLVKAAKSVYHRDYLKTKKKPYREYHPEQTNEGVMDYARGVGQHVGRKVVDTLANKGQQILQPIRQAHAAGQQASHQADRQRLQQSVGETVQQLGTLTLDIYRLSQQLHGSNNSRQQTSEGVFDYMKGAGSALTGMTRQAAGHVAGAINRAGQAVASKGREIHQAGQQRSMQGDLDRLISSKEQLMQRLIQLSKRVGPEVVNKTIDQLFAQRQINLAKKLKKEFAIALQQGQGSQGRYR